MTTQPVVIDFGMLEGPVYTGRERGRRLRDELHLDQVDASGTEVSVEIPETAYTVSSSFFLGLFGPSIVQAGSRDAFFRRYHFSAPSYLEPVVDGYVARALQRRNLFE